MRWSDPQKPFAKVDQKNSLLAGAMPGTTKETRVQIIQALQPVINTSLWMSPRESIAALSQRVELVLELSSSQLTDSIGRSAHKLETGENAFGNDFRRHARRC